MKKVISIILLIIWMVIIFMFSNADKVESTKSSDAVVVGFTEVKDTITNEKTDKEKIAEDCIKYQVIIRKSAHFIEFLILGLLTINCLKYYTDKNTVFICIIICILYAISDEVHQLFLDGRSCQIKDVLIDSTGSIIGIGIYKFLETLKNNKIRQK